MKPKEIHTFTTTTHTAALKSTPFMNTHKGQNPTFLHLSLTLYLFLLRLLFSLPLHTPLLFAYTSTGRIPLCITQTNYTFETGFAEGPNQ